MKIACCISGNGRTAGACRPYLDRFFRGHEVDWFVHAWPGDDSHIDLFAPTAVSRAPLPDDAREKERRAIERFQSYCFIRLIPMYWGISQSISLVPDTGYNLIVRLRPDVIPHQRLNHALTCLEVGAVHFAQHIQDPVWKWRPPDPPFGATREDLGGFNDLLFYGDPEAMRPFAHSYDWIDAFCAHPYASKFTASQLLFTFVETHIGRAARAPIWLYLMDEDNAARPLVEYQRATERAQARFAADVAQIRDHWPDLGEIASRPPSYNPQEWWFEMCWSDNPSDPSPRISPTAQRLARRNLQRHQEETIPSR